MFGRMITVSMAALGLGGCAGGNMTAQSGGNIVAQAEENAASVALRSHLDREVPELLVRHEVPSVAVAYLADGEIQWTANYGERAPGEPAGSDTLYNIASVTKSVVAETILRLAATGRIDLDAPMAPAFVDPDLAGDARGATLTPVMALSHRTGFAQNWRRDMEGGRLAISWEPGTRAFYSGENFAYLAGFATAATGRTLDDLAREMVFGPAGMADTWFRADPRWEGRVAMVRGRDGTLRLPDRQNRPNAADDMHTTIGDFARFVRFAMRGDGLTPALIDARGTIYDDQVAQACPPGVIPPELCPQHTGFGLGWMIYDSGENRFLLHNGRDWGERAIALFEPEKRYGVVILTSGANGRSVISEIMQVLVPDARLNALVAAEARFDR